MVCYHMVKYFNICLETQFYLYFHASPAPFDCRHPKDGYVLDQGPGRYYRVLENVLWNEASEERIAVVEI